MKKILVLGAGQSAPFLIHRLLQLAETRDWKITVGDLDKSLAEPPGTASIRCRAFQKSGR